MVNSEDATTCSVSNNTIYSSSTQTQRCSELKSTIGSSVFSSFKPYSYKFGSISGDCCYLENNDSECSKISKNLTEIYTYDCSGCIDDNRNSMHTAKICGVKPVIFESGNLKALLTLILICFISTFLYALFVVGPFIFWMKQAPNIPIVSPNCYKGMSVLERHYPHKYDKLPYNYHILDNCKANKSNTKYPSFDKCPSTPSVKSGLDKNNSLSGETTWDMITKPFGGFPYNLLPAGGKNTPEIKEKEKKMKEIRPILFLVTWFICIMYFFIMSAPYLGSSNSNTGSMVGTTFLIFFLYALIFAYINSQFLGGWKPGNINAGPDEKRKKAQNSVKKAGVLEIGFLILTLVLSIITGANFNGANQHKYALVVMALLTLSLFSIMCYISYLPHLFKKDLDDSPKKIYNYKFFDVFLKMWYYLKKSVVFSIRESLVWGRGVQYGFFNYIKEWPIPTSFFIIFGSIPHIIAYIIAFARMIMGFLAGIRGAFGHRNIDPDTKKPYGLPDTLASGFFGFIIGVPLGLIANIIFNTFSYHFIPLLYPKFMTQMIKCNIKTFTFVFGLSVLSAMWGRHGVHKYNYVPKPVLICMTITFAIITLYNIYISSK